MFYLEGLFENLGEKINTILIYIPTDYQQKVSIGSIVSLTQEFL